MQRKPSLKDINENFGVIIGNFDGVHLGHKTILETFIKKCQLENIKTCIFTYKPHPAFVLEKVHENFLIQSYEEKIQTFQSMNVDYVVELDFTDEVSHLDGEDFFKQSFTCCPHLKAIFPGHDFSFGSNREFGINELEEICSRNNINVFELERITSRGKRISSTLIREKLVEGNIKEASEFLGRDYSVSSTVVHGYKNGRKMNFPTVNISLKKERVLPKVGVYKTLIKYKNQSYKSLTNIGYRPTFDGQELSVETFILNFSSEIYGEIVEVVFLDFIRDEKKFSSFDELKSQINKDLKYAWK